MSVLISIYMGIASLFYTPTPVTPVNPGRVPEPASTLKATVMTYNLKTSGTGEYSIENRKDSVMASIREYMPDSVGFEEANEKWVKILSDELTEYAHVGIGRDPGGKGEASPVFYLKDKYEVTDSGTFWLSESPDVPGVVGWGAMCPRVCSYAILREKESGKRLAFANTHTDHYSALAREKGMLLIIERMKEFGEGAPIVFTGDHNCRETEVPAQAVAKMLRNALYESETPPTGPWRTFNGWKWLDSEIATLDALRESPEERNAPERACRIDYIYVSPGVHVLDYATVADVRRVLHLYPSDHFPIVSTIEI